MICQGLAAAAKRSGQRVCPVKLHLEATVGDGAFGRKERQASCLCQPAVGGDDANAPAAEPFQQGFAKRTVERE